MRNDIIAIVAPDIHGRTFWKKAAESYDGSVPFIFLGDYLDPYAEENITPNQAKLNFNEIWEFKEKYSDNVIMLLGNHDLSYYDNFFRCCRFSYENYWWYNQFLKENFDKFKFVHSITNNNKTFLFSHAGINPIWLEYNYFEKKYTPDYINSLFITNKRSFNDYSFYRGGYKAGGSPVWSDIREFVSDENNYIPENIIQVVGHTQLTKDMLKTNNVYCIDSRKMFVLTKDNKIEKYEN
jgi:hypothetical protein